MGQAGGIQGPLETTLHCSQNADVSRPQEKAGELLVLVSDTHEQ